MFSTLKLTGSTTKEYWVLTLSLKSSAACTMLIITSSQEG